MAEFDGFQRTMTHGDTHLIPFTVTQDGIPRDISAYQKLWFTAKLAVEDDDTAAVVLLTDAVAGGITRLDAANGQCEAEIPATATAALPNRRTVLYCDLQAKDAVGRIWTLIRGTITMLPDITGSTA